MKAKSRLIFSVVSLMLLLIPAFARVHAAVSVPMFWGSSSYIDLGSPPELQIPSGLPFTVEAWIRIEYHRKEVGVYSKGDGRGNTRSIMFALRENGTRMSALDGSVWREATLPSPIALDSWHHLAFSFDGTHMTFIFDGIEVAKQVYRSVDVPNHTAKIGGERLCLPKFCSHPPL